MSTLDLGAQRSLAARSEARAWAIAPEHLVTHGVILGMTGSGKTGLLLVMIEEALRAGVPVLMIDVKGDLANLGLAFPSHDPAQFAPWLDPSTVRDGTVEARCAALASARSEGLDRWTITAPTLAGFLPSVSLRVLTPGSTAGEAVHILSSLERRSPRWDTDVASARNALSAAVSLVLRLVRRDPDPASSREHVLLSLLAEHRLRPAPLVVASSASLYGNDGRSHDEGEERCSLAQLVRDITDPPFDTVGAMAMDDFLSPGERRDLAAAINALLASPTFSSWRTGASLSPASWLAKRDGKTSATILSVAHLDDEARALVLGVVLEELLEYVRAQSGTSSLRALLVFDEVYGFLPPHPANPPTRRPLVALLKQARAFGVGVLVATQNPMDLDYRALSNAGLWCVGRLQTDADRARIVESLSPNTPRSRTRPNPVTETLKRLAPRWFVVRDVHSGEEPFLAQPRHAMSWLKGPMTPRELALLRETTAPR
jgi:hypothetical protein